MAREKICGIYCIENLVNGKKYIGQSVDIYYRWLNHKSALKRKKHCNEYLQRSWDKYGEDNFDFVIIEVCNNKLLNEKELYWVQKFNSYTNGYNLTDGGLSNPMKYEKSREKLSNSLLGNTHWLGKKHKEESKEKIGRAHKNKIVTDETRRKLSQARSGTKVINHTGSKHSLSKAVDQIDLLTNEVIATYESINLAEIKFAGKRTGNIKRAKSIFLCP